MTARRFFAVLELMLLRTASDDAERDRLRTQLEDPPAGEKRRSTVKRTVRDVSKIAADLGLTVRGA